MHPGVGAPSQGLLRICPLHPGALTALVPAAPTLLQSTDCALVTQSSRATQVLLPRKKISLESALSAEAEMSLLKWQLSSSLEVMRMFR